jgi:hypothetical protein
MMGLIEMFVVLGFALAWGAVELVGMRLDKQKAQAAPPPHRRKRAKPRRK